MSVPDRPDTASTAPARVRYSRAEEVAWYATLASMFGAAAALPTARYARHHGQYASALPHREVPLERLIVR